MKYLLWDFDGTLGYREGMWSGALAEVLRRHDMTIATERIRPYLQTGFPWHKADTVRERGCTADEWWRALDSVFENAFLGLGVDAGRIPPMIRDVRTAYCDTSSWKLFDDAIPAIENLTAGGWHHLLLSNHVPELRDILRSLAILHHFDFIFNSAETGCEKPHPQAFRAVCDTLGTSGHLWMIGDSYEADIAGAEAAGMRAVLVRKKHEKATRYCATLAELDTILRC